MSDSDMDESYFLNELKIRLEKWSSEQRSSNRGDREQASGPRPKIAYGTAGFRGEARSIEHLFFNVGLIAALRCLKLKSNVGLMITASHNPVQDNGVKLIDSNGEMLDTKWEPIVEDFCNLTDLSKVFQQIQILVKDHEISLKTTNDSPKVFLGMDSRPSSPFLTLLARQGIEIFTPSVSFINFGQLTTPALHYLVAESNKQKKILQLNHYYSFLATGLGNLFDSIERDNSNYDPRKLIVDCANGVGRETMNSLINLKDFQENLPVKLINVGDGTLNEKCGADFVKTTTLPPLGANDGDSRYASLDGDADRVVYFKLSRPNQPNQGEKFDLTLIDGDKIMALIALFLSRELKKSKMEDLTLGVVQTAYANGASTDYMTQVLGLVVDCVDTGVKNLHKKASEYDFGVYFEANGHGSIHVSDRARQEVSKRCNPSFNYLINAINSYTGDAISDIVVVEAILKQLDWSLDSWINLYQDRPNVLTKVSIKDKSLVKTTNAGRTCLKPDGLQEAIDALVEEAGPGSRSFVRASGTENVVRVYAETTDEKTALVLAEKVGNKVMELC